MSFEKITREQILKSKCVNVIVTDIEVKEKDFTRIGQAISVLKKCKKKARGKLLLTFSGYDFVPKEIFEIGEIRKYVYELFRKYPYIFYFLTSLDINNKLLLACLVDINTLVLGDKMSGGDMIIKGITPGEAPKIGIGFNIPMSIEMKIKQSTRDYAMNIKDFSKKVDHILSDLFDIGTKPKNNLYQDYDENSVLDAYDFANKQIWQGFVRDMKNKVSINEDNIKEFAQENRPYVLACIKEERYSTPILLSKDTTTNVFLITDPAYGEVCEKCGNNTALVIKNDMEVNSEELDQMVFIPSIENFISKQIAPLSHVYLSQIPVPINVKKDKWYCPECDELHSFKYDENIGLMY